MLSNARCIAMLPASEVIRDPKFWGKDGSFSQASLSSGRFDYLSAIGITSRWIATESYGNMRAARYEACFNLFARESNGISDCGGDSDCADRHHRLAYQALH